MSRIRRIAPGLGRGGLLGNTEGPEAYLRELDTLPSQFCRATGGTETVIEEGDEAVSLLLNFDGSSGSTTFTDQSIYAHTVTANGDAQISTTQSKFGGSSAYFDGNNDWLTVASKEAFSFGTNDFTIEFWARLTDTSAIQTIIDARSTTTATPWALWIDESEKINLRHGANILTSSQSITYDQWQHYSITRSSGLIRIFLDGVADANTVTNTSAIDAESVSTYIGRVYSSASLFLNGYIDSLRIVKGKALYNGNFTPTASAPTNKTGKYYRVHTFTDTDPTSLLLNFDGSNGSTTFTDDSGWGHAVTANGNAAISTTQSKFGGSSLALDGTGDYLTVPDVSQFDFGSGAFTIEAWIFSTKALNATNDTILDTRDTVAGERYYFFINTDGKLRFTHAEYNVGDTAYTGTSVLSQSTWYHVAVSRSGNTLRLFVDGAEESTSDVSGKQFNAQPMNIGYKTFAGSSLTYWQGYIDSLRITKGQALYTAAFTPSTTALTRVGSGSLTFTRGGVVEYLVVGGGGGGGRRHGGGGGAGAFASGISHGIAGSVNVNVGDGGAGAGGGVVVVASSSGQDSILLGVTAIGGGTGGSYNVNGGADASTDGGSGGSGGGAASPAVAATASGGVGIAGVGNDGGLAYSGAGVGGGGGGGAGSVGGDEVVSPSTGGTGGSGSQSDISGTAYFYAAGGGGSADTTPGAGGSGIGGQGATGDSAGGNGTANTGSGGGGARAATAANTASTGGSGGSGIVIARYRITQAEYGGSPLLDLYSGAAAAYSLRSLSSSYTGPVVTVRRSSDDAEADFTASEVAGGALATWVGANDGFVTTWYDQSGNGNNAAQATSGAQPKIVSSGSLVEENGRPAMQFDGTDDYMLADIDGFQSISNLCTAFVTSPTAAAVADSGSMVWWNFGRTGLPTGRGLLLGSSTGALSGEYITIAFDYFGNRDNRLGSSSYRRSANTLNLIFSTHLSTGTKMYADGTEVSLDLSAGMTTSTAAAPSDTGYTTDNLVFLGAVKLANDSIVGFSEKKVLEMIFYPSDVSAQRTDIEAEISQAYGI